MTTPREDRAASPSVREALAALLESAAIGSDAVAGGLMSNPHWPALVAAILAEGVDGLPDGWFGQSGDLGITREYLLTRLSARSRRDEGGAANG